MSKVATGSGVRHSPQILSLLCCLLCAPAHAARVVSLNLCTDELLVLLAPQSIAALSPLARDPALSAVASAASGFARIRPDAEAVLALHPDLVLAGDYGTRAVLAVLRGRGVRVVQVGEPTDFAGVAAEVTQIASLLGAKARGAALVARMWAGLQAASGRPRGTAVLWQARGYAAGPGSFGDAVLRAAGFADAGNGGQMGIEALVARPPDVLVSQTAPAYPSLSTSMLSHPALAGIRRIALDPAWLACPGPWSIKAVSALVR